MTDVIYSDGTSVTYGYNEVGSTTTMTDATGTTTYQYDDMQRLVSTTDSNDKTVSYTYDILGRKTSITTPDNTKTSYAYDVMDRLVEVSQNGAAIAEYEYDANSQLISNVRNDITTTYEYNELGQITQLTTSDINSQIQQFSYQYDKLGNITKETRTETDTVNARTYEYDSANQLTKFTDNDYEETYTYDNVGNMLTKSINDDIISYNYNNANQLIEEIKDNQTVTYKYNENGDLTSKSTGEQYSYDIQGNLTAITGNGIDKEYTYNGNGNRLSETTNGETVYYVNDVNRRYEEVLQTYDQDGNTINTYTYGLQRIDSKGQTNETYLYDGRGSVVGAVDNSNQFVSYSYTAYGELMPSSPTPNVFGYNGEATDFETGLQYLRARYYDATISRFFQEDDYRGKKSLPKTLNRYIYAVDSPIRYDDPSGHRAVDDESMVVPEFVFDKKLRSVENYINDSLENIYTPDPKMNRVEEVVNDSLSNIDGNFSDRNISNPSGAGSQYCDYNSTQYVYSDPEGNLFIVDQLIDANNIAGDILTYKGSIVLNNAGLPQTIEIIENGKYYQVSGF